jgi:hypothetical protein
VKIHWPSAPKVLTGLLVVLLPVLAFMQYRWVGQVSEGERERMQRNLETAADQFRADFDGELGRARQDLTVSTAAAREGSSPNYSFRYNSWLSTADHPQIVADVYVVDAEGGHLRLRKFNSATHAFDPSLWTAELDRHRTDFENAYTQFKAQREAGQLIRDAFSAEESLIVAQLQNFEFGPPRSQARQTGPQFIPTTPDFGYTVIQLDEAYLRGQLIPALSEKHFSSPGGDMFRVAVISGDDSRRVLYRSSPDATIDVSHADVTVPLRRVPAAADAAEVLKLRAVVRITGRASADGQRPGADLQRADELPPRWRLIVQHQSGSLEAAGRHDSPSQSRHQLGHPAPADVRSRNAGGYVSPR